MSLYFRPLFLYFQGLDRTAEIIRFSLTRAMFLVINIDQESFLKFCVRASYVNLFYFKAG
jgi:hypothetical protein